MYDGTIGTSYSFSNDFTVSKSSGDGTYVITFQEWKATYPTLVITLNNGNPRSSYSVVYTIDKLDDGRYTATVYTYKDTYKSDQNFGFQAMFGHALAFTAPATLTLTPSVISFGSPSTLILKLSTTITLKINGVSQSFTTDLDKGTSLLGVGTTMTLSLSTASVTSGSNTWTLTGYTYSGGSATTGVEWTGSSTTLSVGAGGPVTTPELFVIKGTPGPSNANKSTLSTDPLVRLTSVPPAGLAM